MADNIITAVFGATRETKVRPRYRYDQGQVLIVRGVKNLPDFYEVHFANEGSTADATPLIGTAEGVTIPDSYFQSGATIYAYIYVHDEATDGTTVYKVTIPIINRARPANVEPTPEEEDIISQAIVALNENVGKAEAAAEQAEESVAVAQSAADGAAQAERHAGAHATRAIGASQAAQASEMNASSSATTAQEAAQSASESSQNASGYADAAGTYADSASRDKDLCETYYRGAMAYADQANTARDRAQTYANNAHDSELAAGTAATNASNAQAAAASAATNAGNAQTAAEAAQSAAETAETNAQIYAGQAQQSATNAGQSAASAAQTLTQVQAEGAAQIAAIDTEGQRVLDSIPEDYTEVVSDVADLKSQIASCPIESGTGVGSAKTKDYISENTTYSQIASGLGAFAEGGRTSATGEASHAEGYNTNASGNYSHAEGVGTKATNAGSHAEGRATLSKGYGTHAEGQDSLAIGNHSHAEGKGESSLIMLTGSANATTYSFYAFDPSKLRLGSYIYYTARDILVAVTAIDAANNTVTVSSTFGDAMNMGLGSIYNCYALGKGSHVEGNLGKAVGDYSHVEGTGSTALSPEQHVQGKYNIPDADSTYVEIVGNGTTDNARSNARTLDWSGNESLAGSITLGKGTEDEVTLSAVQLKQLLALLN